MGQRYEAALLIQTWENHNEFKALQPEWYLTLFTEEACMLYTALHTVK